MKGENIMNKLKRILSTILMLCLMLSLLPGTAWAADAVSGTCGDNLTWTLKNHVLTISGTGAMTDWSLGGRVPWAGWSSDSVYYVTSVTIGDGVTSIGGNAFDSCVGLTSITIPNSVTSIGASAFHSCGKLTSITIPNSVASIGESAFFGCSSLTGITIPNSVDSIGEYAFYGCSSLTSMTIPSSVTSIGKSTFSGCGSLTSITIPDSVTSIGESAFVDCSRLTSITIPDSVTSIGKSAFIGCSSLASVTIPDGVTSIGDSTFYRCSSLTSVTIPDSVTSIGLWAFHSCKKLTSITIPDGVTSIGNSAFSGCSSLTSITIPDGVTSIGESTFSDCNSLTNITIPDSVTNIQASAFEGCNNLTDVYYDGTKAQWDTIEVKWRNDALLGANIHYKDEPGETDAPDKADEPDVTLNPPGAPFRVDFYPNGGKITSIRGFDADEIVAGSMTAQENDIFVDRYSGIGMIMTGENGRLDCLPVAEREGYTLLGWGASERELMSTSTIFTADAKLMAIWTPVKSYTVTFNLNGVSGTAPKAQTVAAGKTVRLPTLPDTGEFIFKGWGYSEDGRTLKVWDADRAVTADLTLYAIWQKSDVLVAIVDGKDYSTLQAAVDAVKNGGWVEILTNDPISAVVSRAVQFSVVPGSEGIDDLSNVDIKAGSGYTLAKTNVDGRINYTVSKDAKYDLEPGPTTGIFIDVPAGAYYCDAVEWAVEGSITAGTGDGTTFSPNATCTRKEIVTFLWRAAGCPEPSGGGSLFTDVSPDAYYSEAVRWAVENGVTAGTGDGTTFSPDKPCTRKETMTFLWSAAGQPGASAGSAFTDVDANAYYAPAVQWAVENRITSGTGGGTTFSPDKACSRAEIVTFLCRHYGG